MEPVETSISAQECEGAAGEEPRRKGRVQHWKKKLFPIWHDNASTERFHFKTKTHQTSARLSIIQMV